MAIPRKFYGMISDGPFAESEKKSLFRILYKKTNTHTKRTNYAIENMDLIGDNVLLR